MATTPSLKRVQIDKANTVMVAVVAASAFIVIFCIFSGDALLGQLSYQNRVITAKQKSLDQLKVDVSAESQLNSSYAKFVSPTTNIIGGSSTGTGPSDGDNAQIVLDALPSQYDFPALTTSLQTLLSGQGVAIDSIAGTDQAAQIAGGSSAASSDVTSSSTAANIGSAVAMPFTFSVEGPYQNIENVITTFEKSIRPFQIDTESLSGSQSDVTLNITAQTYYQPQQAFKITTQAVK